MGAGQWLSASSITGGGGFIGAYLVKRLVADGWDVAVVDTMVRGDASRFAEVADEVELFTCDVRDQDALERAFEGAEVVMHLAAINGTENFYKQTGTRARCRSARRPGGGEREPQSRGARSGRGVHRGGLPDAGGRADTGDDPADAARQPQPSVTPMAGRRSSAS